MDTKESVRIKDLEASLAYWRNWARDLAFIPESVVDDNLMTEYIGVEFFHKKELASDRKEQVKSLKTEIKNALDSVSKVFPATDPSRSLEATVSWLLERDTRNTTDIIKLGLHCEALSAKFSAAQDEAAHLELRLQNAERDRDERLAWKMRAEAAEAQLAEMETSRNYAREELGRWIDGAASRQDVSERALSLVSLRANKAEARVVELEADLRANWAAQERQLDTRVSLEKRIAKLEEGQRTGDCYEFCADGALVGMDSMGCYQIAGDGQRHAAEPWFVLKIASKLKLALKQRAEQAETQLECWREWAKNCLCADPDCDWNDDSLREFIEERPNSRVADEEK